jgi:hypothetical protein
MCDKRATEVRNGDVNRQTIIDLIAYPETKLAAMANENDPV